MLDARFGDPGGDLVVLEDVVVSKDAGADQHRLADGDRYSHKGDNSRPPKLTLAQITQRRLEPKGSNLLPNDVPQIEVAEGEEGDASPDRFSAAQARFAGLLRSKFGPDWIFDHSLINPLKIIEEAADRPMSAAFVCHQACILLNNGHHTRVRQYLVAAFSVACGFRAHPEQIKALAREISDGRSSNPLKIEIVEQNLLHYVFAYIFLQSGMVTRDRASQYAQSLQYYFDRAATLNEVDDQLKKHGQDKLRKAAQYRASILKGAREWVNLGGDPTDVTMEDVLAAMVAEHAKSKTIKPENEGADHSLPDVAPGDLKFRAEIESLTDDGEWLLENDPEKSPNATGYEADDELESNEAEEEEGAQPPEVDEFFSEMMRLTAQMVVGLSDDRLDARHREAMMSLVQELWTKIMRFRGQLA